VQHLLGPLDQGLVVGLHRAFARVLLSVLLQQLAQLLSIGRNGLGMAQLRVVCKQRVDLLAQLFVSIRQFSVLDRLFFQLDLENVVVPLLRLDSVLQSRDLRDQGHVVLFLRVQLLLQRYQLQPERLDVIYRLSLQTDADLSSWRRSSPR